MVVAEQQQQLAAVTSPCRCCCQIGLQRAYLPACLPASQLVVYCQLVVAVFIFDAISPVGCCRLFAGNSLVASYFLCHTKNEPKKYEYHQSESMSTLTHTHTSRAQRPTSRVWSVHEGAHSRRPSPVGSSRNANDDYFASPFSASSSASYSPSEIIIRCLARALN